MLSTIRTVLGLQKPAIAQNLSPVRRHGIPIDCGDSAMVQHLPPKDHARILIEWLQSPGGRTGSILSKDLERIHRELCETENFEWPGWKSVARELNILLGKPPKEHAGPRRLRVWRIPPKVVRLRPAFAASHAA
jgi:hypothetical protein